MTHAVRSPHLRAILMCLVLGALGATAHAQFETGLTLNKLSYLTYEPVEATINIVNRSGSDIVMGGPNGQAWLSFEVTDAAGNRVPPVRLRTDETIVFKAGTALKRTIRVSDYHPFSEYGSYGITATVFHPPSQQYYASNRVRANFTEVKPFWEQPFGVPLGQPGAGQIRRYALCILRDTSSTHLYVRVLDDRSGLKLSTFCLGTCIMVADPQITIDRDNKLHVLYMAKPHIYAHATVTPQGRLEQVTQHKEIQSDRPKLFVQGDQSIGVAGGAPYVPESDTPPPTKARSIKEKPPGL